MCYKVVFGLVKLSFANFFAFSPVTVIRGHQHRYKLYVNHSCGIRKISLPSVWLYHGICLPAEC